MWKRLLSGATIALALCSNLHAAPALQRFIDLAQPDGSVLKVRQQGDEFQHWTETTSGYTIVRNPKTKYWDYAESAADGRLRASGYRAAAKGLVPPHIAPRLKPPRNKALELHKQKSLKKSYQNRLQGTSLPPSAPSLAVRRATVGNWTPAPVAGEKKLLLVLVNFSDRALVTTAATWGPTVYSPAAKSVARYYADNSFSALNISPATHAQTENPAGVVTVTVAAPHPNGDETYATETTILNQALAQAATAVNFSVFDSDGNGTLEPSELSLYFIYAGYEASESLKTPSVWAHAWGGAGVTAGSKVLTDWAINGELNDAGRQLPIGAMAHELGHALCGLPDLYDISYTNAGMGIFSLMAAGSFGADSGEDVGTTPTALDLWSREYLGWAAPAAPGTVDALAISPSLFAPDSGYKLVTSASASEYFLLENRQPTGWDLGAKDELGADWHGGLLLSHIDISAGAVGANDINDYTASGGRQGVSPVQASTTHCDMVLTGCWGDATTLFFAGNNSAWTPLSAPDSHYYDGTPTNFSLTGISLPEEGMSAAWSTTPLPPLPVVEDFEGGDLSKLSWLTSGNNDWNVTASGYNGGSAATAPLLADSQIATLATTIVTGSGNLSFRYAVDSERKYDFFVFSIDGQEKGRWSGAVNWSRAVYPLTAGSHTLSWSYQKDGGTASGLDRAWIDDLSFPVRHELSVLKVGSGNVTPDPGSLTWSGNTGTASYDHGTIVTLAASADPGSNFSGWGGACSGTDPCVVTMASAQEVIANFALNATSVSLTPTLVSPKPAGTTIPFTALAAGGDAGPYEYRFSYRVAVAGTRWTPGQSYSTSASWNWNTAALPLGAYQILVDVRHVGSAVNYEKQRVVGYLLGSAAPATAVSLTPSLASPRPAGTTIPWTALASGGDAGPYEYRFSYRIAVAGTRWTLGQGYSTSASWSWNTATLPPGAYQILVDVRHVGSFVNYEKQRVVAYLLGSAAPATAVSLTPSLASPRPVGTTIPWTALASGGDAGPYEYRFSYRIAVAGTRWTLGQSYSTSADWSWNTAALPPGAYQLLVDVRHVGSAVNYEKQRVVNYSLSPP